MVIKNKEDVVQEIVIDLTGPDGNAYALMAHAKNLARQLGVEHGPIIEEMTSGDYENLVEVFDKNFGEYVTLLR